MGGSGSTRWRGYTPQPLVEDTPRLDFNSQLWRAVLKRSTASGTLIWKNANGARTAAVAFELGPIEENFARTLVLFTEGLRGSVSVTLEARQVGFDRRWHGQCPLDCGSSSRVLFLTPDDQLGCRLCQRLVYSSSRKSDARVYLCRRNPADLRLDRATEIHTRTRRARDRGAVRRSDRGSRRRTGSSLSAYP